MLDRVYVEYSPAEILAKDLYVKSPEGKYVKVAVTGDAIGTMAWRDLCLNSDIPSKRKFKYQNTQLIDGEFRVTFYENGVNTPDPPGGEK